ncbi:hypothetical protein BC829DRAFT_432363 [Chytridium lagenaria]|nr:hypothetical protein BC829DRAFT_432363 [Chytridium lagenaria]
MIHGKAVHEAVATLIRGRNMTLSAAVLGLMECLTGRRVKYLGERIEREADGKKSVDSVKKEATMHGKKKSGGPRKDATVRREEIERTKNDGSTKTETVDESDDAKTDEPKCMKCGESTSFWRFSGCDGCRRNDAPQGPEMDRIVVSAPHFLPSPPSSPVRLDRGSFDRHHELRTFSEGSLNVESDDLPLRDGVVLQPTCTDNELSVSKSARCLETDPHASRCTERGPRASTLIRCTEAEPRTSTVAKCKETKPRVSTLARCTEAEPGVSISSSHITIEPRASISSETRLSLNRIDDSGPTLWWPSKPDESVAVSLPSNRETRKRSRNDATVMRRRVLGTRDVGEVEEGGATLSMRCDDFVQRAGVKSGEGSRVLEGENVEKYRDGTVRMMGRMSISSFVSVETNVSEGGNRDGTLRVMGRTSISSFVSVGLEGGKGDGRGKAGNQDGALRRMMRRMSISSAVSVESERKKGGSGAKAGNQDGTLKRMMRRMSISSLASVETDASAEGGPVDSKKRDGRFRRMMRRMSMSSF